jgi:hypothetical protein
MPRLAPGRTEGLGAGGGAAGASPRPPGQRARGRRDGLGAPSTRSELVATGLRQPERIRGGGSAARRPHARIRAAPGPATEERGRVRFVVQEALGMGGRLASRPRAEG